MQLEFEEDGPNYNILRPINENKKITIAKIVYVPKSDVFNLTNTYFYDLPTDEQFQLLDFIKNRLNTTTLEFID